MSRGGSDPLRTKGSVMAKVIIELDCGTVVTIEQPDQLDLAEFDKEEAPSEKPRECDISNCRHEATVEVETIDDDGSRTIGHYCQRHAEED